MCSANQFLFYYITWALLKLVILIQFWQSSSVVVCYRPSRAWPFCYVDPNSFLSSVKYNGITACYICIMIGSCSCSHHVNWVHLYVEVTSTLIWVGTHLITGLWEFILWDVFLDNAHKIRNCHKQVQDRWKGGLIQCLLWRNMKKNAHLLCTHYKCMRNSSSQSESIKQLDPLQYCRNCGKIEVGNFIETLFIISKNLL